MLLILTACKEKNKKIVTSQSENTIQKAQPNDSVSYERTKQNVNRLRLQLGQQYKQNKISLKTVEDNFNSIMIDSIFPYWYGTTWDFNGITQTPSKGAIACGYFITTTLQQAGVVLNRSKLGQSASEQIIKTLIVANPKKIICNQPIDSLIAYLKIKGDGLYIIGLDSHVGFIYNNKGALYFIHSKWINPKAVVKEAVKTSGVLASSKYKQIGKLSSDSVLLKRWLSGTRF
ncbi:MAG: hypothetical protein QM541_11460 [Flavobacterium sp.]|nr:hypothetical protein [Flavobacterium sp.]